MREYEYAHEHAHVNVHLCVHVHVNIPRMSSVPHDAGATTRHAELSRKSNGGRRAFSSSLVRGRGGGELS